MPKRKADQPNDTRVLDYSSTMSLYERESLAAEAKLAAERKKKTEPNSAKRIYRIK
jgi:hypothetical protein